MLVNQTARVKHAVARLVACLWISAARLVQLGYRHDETHHMKVAIFTDTYTPEINGVVTSVDTVTNELRSQGHEVYIFAPRYFGKEDPDPRVFRIPSIPFPFPKMRERRISLPWGGMLRQFGKLDFDIIHSQVPGTNGVLALVASRFARVPHVHTYHTHYMEYMHYVPFPTSFSSRGVKWIATRFCGRCQHVISPSRGMRKAIMDHGVDAPISVVPTGIDPDRKHPETSMQELFTKYRLGDAARLEGKRLLVSVGRLGREKNICFLIRALARIRKSHDIHFIMIGHGPDRGEVEEMIDRVGVSDCVTLAGYVEHEDVFAITRLCDLFIFASVTETQGLVLLESMSVGTPVVAVEGIGVSDLLEGDRGGYTTSHNQIAFTAAVNRMLDDDLLLQRKSEDALQRSLEWTEAKQVSKIVAIYERSIAEFKEHGLPRFRHRQRF